jgi:hypothetical protein
MGWSCIRAWVAYGVSGCGKQGLDSVRDLCIITYMALKHSNEVMIFHIYMHIAVLPLFGNPLMEPLPALKQSWSKLPSSLLDVLA